jgi:hypothetical protein
VPDGRQARPPEPVPEDEEREESISLGDVVRGIPTFLSHASIGMLVMGLVAIAAGIAISMALSWLSIPYEPPWDWVPSGIWHWVVTWLAVGGLAAGIGAWAGTRSVRWLERGKDGPRLSRPLLWSLGAVCAVLVGLGVYWAGQIAAEKHLGSVRREVIAPERVCRRDPGLPPTLSISGMTVYDTNENGSPDVMMDESSRGDSFAVLIDPAENGKWPSVGYCRDGKFGSTPEA